MAFFVRGLPQPKGSGSYVRPPHGKAAYIEAGTTRSRKAKKAWYEAVSEQASLNGPRMPVETATVVGVCFYFPIPKSRLRGKRRLIPGDPHTSAPDCDKLQRGVGDALKQAGVIRDDCLIWAWEPPPRKVYCSPGDEGAHVTVRW